MRVENWGKIAQNFRDTLVLGNGASIAIDGRFEYGSLLEKARNLGHLDAATNALFGEFDTRDFELVLRRIYQAAIVNRKLGVPEDRTALAYRKLRDSLARTVRDIHPARAEIEDCLTLVAEFMAQFRTVLSLNYDLLVYWAMLLGNETAGGRWFKDCFVNATFKHNWQELREPIDGLSGATLVFYPHGNLVLGTDFFGNEFKIVRDDEDLLSTIIQKWESAEYSPLFVSEGRSEQKVSSIKRSPYLTHIYDSVLPAEGESVVIFGWSMKSSSDAHIVDRLFSSPRLWKIAISVLDPSDEAGMRAIEETIRRSSPLDDLEIVFFEAASVRRH